jgi:predicted metalloprotease
MRWQGRRQSGNVQYQRGGGFGGGGGRIALSGGGLVVVLLALGLYWCLGGNPLALLQQIDPAISNGSGEIGGVEPTPESEFVAVVLADTEDVWHALFAERGLVYREPTLMVFRGRVDSACGFGSSAIGPFYCPLDETIYIDLEFFDELQRSLGAPGDFAMAYVIAHEVGHHVQKLLGTMDRVHALQERAGERDSNELSVRLELQADFYAGVWAHHAERAAAILEPGDLEEALRAAGAVGDDRLQRRSQGYVVPDSFTHGSSEQRIRWFRRGFESGNLSLSDTFSTDDL